MIRKSGRERKPKSVTDYDNLVEQPKQRASEITTERQRKVSKSTKKSVAEIEVCGKCNLEDSKESRLWLQCQDCESWWHSACARISDTDTAKFEKYNIDFFCAFCVGTK